MHDSAYAIDQKEAPKLHPKIGATNHGLHHFAKAKSVIFRYMDGRQ